MIGWKEYKIGDLCNTISETYKGNDDEVILINTSDVLEGKILNHIPVPNENLKGQFKKTFRMDDILYSEIRPANKRFAFVDIEDTSLYIASTKLMVLRPNTGIVEPKFLFAILSSKSMISELQVRAESRSGTFPQITFGAELGPITVMVPDKDIQLKIVSFLEAFQGKLNTNEAINRNLSEQVKGIFKEWFIDYGKFDGVMPDTWKELTLEDVSILSAGGDKPKNVSNLLTDEWQIPIFSNGISDEGLYGYTDHAKIFDESVTVSARGTIGYVCLRQEPYVPIVRLVSLIPKNEFMTAKYLYLWLESLHIMGTGTTQQQLTVPDFKKTRIIVPNKEIVTQFTETVIPLFDELLKNKKQSVKLAELRDSLLPKLLSGELDVSEFAI